MLRTTVLIAHSHLLVRAISERFLPAWVAFRVGLTNESHWLQLVLVYTVNWWLVSLCVSMLLVTWGSVTRWRGSTSLKLVVFPWILTFYCPHVQS